MLPINSASDTSKACEDTYETKGWENKSLSTESTWRFKIRAHKLKFDLAQVYASQATTMESNSR